MIPYLGTRHSAPEEYPLQNYLQWINDSTISHLKYWYFGHWHMDKELPQKCRAVYLDVIDMETGKVVF